MSEINRCEFMVNKIETIGLKLASACDGNPAISTATVILFYCLFNILEGAVETLIWGDRFEHWLDPLFICAFIAFAAYLVYLCAVFNTAKRIRKSDEI